jgi:hypothetical protein
VTRLAVLVAVGVLGVAGAAFASATVDLRVVGTEVPPISSTRGTFVGTSQGPVGAWRISIRHEALRTGPTVAVTGGSLLIGLRTGTALRSSVTGGSVSVTNRGSHCTTQVYAVHVQLSAGTFDGTLQHHRRSLFGHCVIYAASISGHAILQAQ